VLLTDARFCPLCAAPLVQKVPEHDDRLRHVCSACGFILYLNPKVAAGTVPRAPDGRIGLIRRGVEPGIGKWSWPCGYVEMDETVPGCAVRETREETGLVVELGELLGIYSYAADREEGALAGAGMIIACYAATTSDTLIVAGDDAEEAEWFAPDEIPWELLAFDSSHRGVRDDLRRGGD
jgi:ADP-ribose pyrophosphatase YjhB (NUDIX family)